MPSSGGDASSGRVPTSRLPILSSRGLLPTISVAPPHRRTAASLAVSARAHVKSLQRMLGHASAAMTLDVYADLFDDDLDAVAAALNDRAVSSSVGEIWAEVSPDQAAQAAQAAREGSSDAGNKKSPG